MKKTLFIILLLSCFAGAFAETGYNGLQWGMDREDFVYIRNTIKKTNGLPSSTEIEEKLILGAKNKVYYHFPALTLWAISYTIPQEKTSQLLSKFVKEKQVEKIQYESFSQNEIQKIHKKNDPEKEINYFMNDYFYSIIMLGVRIDGIEELKIDEGNGKSTVYIYDYNDDTRVYIFENLVEGLTFVYYAQHEQDF